MTMTAPASTPVFDGADSVGDLPSAPSEAGADEPDRGVPDTAVGRWWVASMLVTAILLVVLIGLWVLRDRRPMAPESELVLSNAEIIEAESSRGNRGAPDEVVRLETGVFIQSLRFDGPNDVHLTGYLWHRFPGDVAAAIDPADPKARVPVLNAAGEAVDVRPGFILPEQVDSQFELELRSVIFNEPGGGSPASGAPQTTIAKEAVDEVTPGRDGTTEDDAGRPDSTAPTLPPMLFRDMARGTDRLDAAVPGRVDALAAGSTTALYYFEAPVRQPFTYADFPFDHKVVWLRIWPAEFERNVVLVPDRLSYPCPPPQPNVPCTKVGDVFGVDEAIELGGFSREETYFDYFRGTYNSNLGADRFQQRDYPELRFNLVVRRDLLNAFVSNLVPLGVAAGLAFAVLMTIRSNGSRQHRFGFSTTQVMTTLGALFFAVLMAHQSLRQQFEGVVYFEYFYFLMYLVLLGVAVVAILVSAPATRDLAVVRFGDNLLARVLYWPTILLTMVVITLVAL